MLRRITIDVELKNRNPLFPELEIIAGCYVIVRYVCVGKRKSHHIQVLAATNTRSPRGDPGGTRHELSSLGCAMKASNQSLAANRNAKYTGRVI